jgi:hypothetical protein
MKPCSQNQMRLAMLAINALEEGPARELHRHLATCEGCRDYLEQLRAVSRNIAEIQPLVDGPRAGDFHQRLLARLKAEQPKSIASQVTNLVRRFTFSWRAALPVLGASAAAIALLLILHHRPRPVELSIRVVTTTANLPSPKTDSAPTLSTYQFLANHSPEKLDELLTRQASRNPAPAPVYTPATLARSDLLE